MTHSIPDPGSIPFESSESPPDSYSSVNSTFSSKFSNVILNVVVKSESLRAQIGTQIGSDYIHLVVSLVLVLRYCIIKIIEVILVFQVGVVVFVCTFLEEFLLQVLLHHW